MTLLISIVSIGGLVGVSRLVTSGFVKMLMLVNCGVMRVRVLGVVHTRIVVHFPVVLVLHMVLVFVIYKQIPLFIHIIVVMVINVFFFVML